MWFWLSLIALLCWSGSDLFSKIGCKDQDDRLSHLKMVTAVGVVMGLHAAYEIFIGGVEINFQILLTYLPVSALYIASMAIGYIGLRYIELSISSGALVAVLTLVTAGRGAVNNFQLLAVAFVCVGVIALGVVEATEDEELRLERQKKGNRIYAKSFLALVIPIIYCLLDALGTFADSIVLETLDENSANVAYELTFFLVGVLSLCYVLFVKRDKLQVKREVPKYIGACFETAGQFAYIFAIADRDHIMLSAPIISAYCVASVLWGRLFLKERLSWKHYASILLVVVGIVIIGIFDV